MDKIIQDVIAREGGFVNHPDDKGGPTKYGITQATLAKWRGVPVAASQVEELTEEEAAKIYYKLYLTDTRVDHILDKNLQALVFDYAVHSGAARAIKDLQRVLGLKDDGEIGPLTLQAANYTQTGNLRKKYLAARISFLGRLITDKPTQAVFAAGWMNRMGELLREYV